MLTSSHGFTLKKGKKIIGRERISECSSFDSECGQNINRDLGCIFIIFCFFKKVHSFRSQHLLLHSEEDKYYSQLQQNVLFPKVKQERSDQYDNKMQVLLLHFPCLSSRKLVFGQVSFQISQSLYLLCSAYDELDCGNQEEGHHIQKYKSQIVVVEAVLVLINQILLESQSFP